MLWLGSISRFTRKLLFLHFCVFLLAEESRFGLAQRVVRNQVPLLRRSFSAGSKVAREYAEKVTAGAKEWAENTVSGMESQFRRTCNITNNGASKLLQNTGNNQNDAQAHSNIWQGKRFATRARGAPAASYAAVAKPIPLPPRAPLVGNPRSGLFAPVPSLSNLNMARANTFVSRSIGQELVEKPREFARIPEDSSADSGEELQNGQNGMAGGHQRRMGLQELYGRIGAKSAYDREATKLLEGANKTNKNAEDGDDG